jgi:hypothetical protein
MSGVIRQDVSINSLGFSQPSGLVMAQRLLELVGGAWLVVNRSTGHVQSESKLRASGIQAKLRVSKFKKVDERTLKAELGLR